MLQWFRPSSWVGGKGHKVTLPPEVIQNVAAHCHPSALLMLSRTSKSLRSFVASPSSKAIWEDAFAACGLGPFESDERNLMQWAQKIWFMDCEQCLQFADCSRPQDTDRVCFNCLRECYMAPTKIEKALEEGGLSRSAIEEMTKMRSAALPPPSAHLLDEGTDLWMLENYAGWKPEPWWPTEEPYMTRRHVVIGGPPHKATLPADANDALFRLHPMAFQLARKRSFVAYHPSDDPDETVVMHLPELLQISDVCCLLEAADRVNMLPRRGPVGRSWLDEYHSEMVVQSAPCYQNAYTVSKWSSGYSRDARLYKYREEVPLSLVNFVAWDVPCDHWTRTYFYMGPPTWEKVGIVSLQQAIVFFILWCILKGLGRYYEPEREPRSAQ